MNSTGKREEIESESAAHNLTKSPNATTRSDSGTFLRNKGVDELLQAGGNKRAMQTTRRMDAPQIATPESQAMQTPERHPPLPRKYWMQAEAMERYSVNGAQVMENSMLRTSKYLYG